MSIAVDDAMNGAAGYGYAASQCAMFRTSNAGVSWDSIGPPVNGEFDIMVPPACQGAVVIAEFYDGGVWMTTSGGDGTIPMPDDTLNIDPVVFKSVNACDSTFAPLSFSSCGCRPGDYRFDSVRVVGDDRFSVVNTSLFPKAWDGFNTVDTLQLKYVPKNKIGDATAQVHIYGRLIRDSVEVFFDSVVTVTATSTAKPELASASPFLNLGDVNLCGEGTEKFIEYRNNGCAPVTITRQDVAAAGFEVEDLALPLTVPVDSTIRIRVFVMPTDETPMSGTVTLQAATGEQQQSVAVTLLARGTRGPGELALESNSIDFGTMTVCELDSMLLALGNGGCDSLTIEPAIISGDADFSLVPLAQLGSLGSDDTVTYGVQFTPLGIGDRTGSIRIRSKSQSSANWTESVITLRGTVTLPGDPLAVSTPIFNTISFCSTDSIQLPITNRSCDSELVQPVITGTSDFGVTPTTPSRLAPGETGYYTLHFTPTVAGTRTGTLRIQATDLRFGVPSLDTILPLSAIALPGDKTLAASEPAVNFGTMTVCDNGSRSITLRNEGCDTLLIHEADITGSFEHDGDFPIVLKPQETRTITVTTLLDTVGGNMTSTGLLRFTSNADNTLPAITLSRGYKYPRTIDLTLTVNGSGSAHESEDVRMTIAPVGDMTDVERVSFDLVYDSDLLSAIALTTGSLGAVTRDADGLTRQRIAIDAPLGVSLTELEFSTRLAVRAVTPIRIENIRLNESDPDFENCVARVQSATGGEFSYLYNCGDRELQNFLRDGSMPFSIIALHPNPVSDVLTVDLDDVADVSVTVIDALGKRVLTSRSSSNKIELDTRGLSDGLYFLEITAQGSQQVRGFVKR